MANSEIKIFYSWQSDLPANETRNLIQDSIKDAVRLLRDTVEIDADRDTKGEFGSPDIVQTIFSKIADCDIFIADVSAVCEYHPLDKDGNQKSETKLTPNPNVLVELGNAANIIGWENIILVVNTDYGDAGSMPFDIAHHRLATYSLKDNSKGEVKKKLKEIIVGTVENILENGKRVRPQFSNIQLGSYDKSTKEICKRIIPYVLKNESEYINAKQQQIESCRILADKIRSTHLVKSTNEIMSEIISADNPESDPETNTEVVIDNGNLIPAKTINLFTEYEVNISDSDKCDIIQFTKEKLGYEIENEEDFFCVGNLKKKNSFNPFGATYDLIGTDDEISKYNAICELSYMITELEVWGHYLDTFEGMVFLPLAVINNSSVADEDITVSIEIDREKAEIILPTRDLFNTEIDGLQGKIYEMDIMKKYLMMAQTSDIQYDADISYSVEDVILEQKRLGSSAGINGTPMFDEEDYERELSKYIATPMEGAISEYVFKIKTLHALEKKWLGGAILLKPIADSFEITYSVKSHSSDGKLSGVLTYYKE